MGIRGLTGFIDRNPHLLHAHELHDIPVVIDGNNLYHFLYYGRHIRCAFGGDYDTYRKRIIQTFDSFSACGITPYIIFDGAYTRDGRKLHTSISRAKARIRLVDCVTNTERGQALPALAYETFIQTLNELKIPQVTCQFEADSEVAVLANKMNCPVISNDSDFYIFDIPAGFLPLDYIDFNVLTKYNEAGDEQYKFLFVRKYHIDELVDSFDGLSRSVLPLFASMLGNDFINANAFQSFYSRFKVPKVVSKKFHLPPKLHKVINVLHWLHSNKEDMDEAMDKLLEFVHEKRRDKIKKMLTTSVQGYCNTHTFEGFDLYKYFNCKVGERLVITVSDEFQHYGGTPFPQWFLEAGSCSNLSTFIVNSAVLHQVIILCQMEDLTQASSYNCSSEIRRVFYGVLLKDEVYNKDNSLIKKDTEESSFQSKSECLEKPNEETVCENMSSESPSENVNIGNSHDGTKPVNCDDRENASGVSYLMSKEGCVEEYERLKKGIKKSLIQPTFEVNNQMVPGFMELSTLSVQKRGEFLWKALQVDESWIHEFSDELKLFVACLVTWSCSPDTKLNILHLDAVLVCALVLHCELELDLRQKTNVQTCQDTCDSEKFIDFMSVTKYCSSDCLEKIKQNLLKYHYQAPTFTRRTVYEPQITHAFAQLQACIVDSLNLNKILRKPVPNPSPSQLINGTLLYNLYGELETRPRPDLFISSLLENSALHKVFLSFKVKMLSYVSEECFETSRVRANIKRRKRKTKVEARQEEETEIVHMEEEFDHLSTVDGFDVANKFALLSAM